ncbi:MAG: hypothetical protein M3401_04160 [Actinomycetota bacterium]|nr:hypothetical protein [Actinomycetota bacterium]
MTDDRTYLAELERALKRRGLDEARTAEVIREMSNHFAESGERPVEAFGEPEQYAAALLAADQPEGDADEREARTFRATAADEVEILADLGRDGWELTGVRDFGLRARRPLEPAKRTTWEYVRRTGVRRGPLVTHMQAEGWTPSGRWLTFHYFKRPRADAPTGWSPAASS